MKIYILSIFIIIISFLLLLIILIQNPKGGGLSQNFGNQNSQMFDIQSTSNFFEKSTWILSFFLFIIILIFNYYLKLK